MQSYFWAVRPILRYGASCEVIAPESFRQAIAKEIAVMAKVYGQAVQAEPEPEAEADTSRNWLVDMRKKKKASQADLAAFVGVSTRTMTNWEKADHRASLTLPQVKRFCQFFTIPIEAIPDNFPFYDA